MLKSIKKTYNILIGTLAAFVLSLSVLFLVIRIPAIQTFITRKVTDYISDETKSTVSVGKVKFSFFNKLQMTEILIKDQHNDTLLYVPSLTIGIRQISRKNNSYKLGKVVIIKPVIGFITDSTGLMNLTWYLNMIQKPSDSTSVKSSYFHINQIELSDARFSLVNKYGPPSRTILDLNNFRLKDINAIVENLDIKNNSTSFDIYNLGFKESNGFVVKKMSSNILFRKQNILLSDVNLLCDSSIINADRIGFLADSASSFKRFSEEVKLDISLRKSLINFNDLKYFITSLKDYNESVWLSGDVTGTISELRGRNIKLTYTNETFLDCNFDFSGLPDIKKTFIFIDVNDLRSISKDIEQIKLPGKGYILLPEVLRKLGAVSFSGSFTGFTTDFVTYGKFNTNKGIISTDLSLRPSRDGYYNVTGLIRGSDIDLGSITNNPILFGNLSIEANIDGTAASFKKFAVNLTGKIDSVEINNYKYRNISLKGLFTDKAWDGNIKVEDQNIKMDLLGMFDFNRKLPEFDFTLNLLKSNLFKLNIDKSDTSSSLTMLLTANFNGSNIDNLDGEIKLLNSTFRKHGSYLDLYDFSIKTFASNNLPSIHLRTDFIDANLHGKYNFAEVGDIIRRKLAELMPSRFEKPKTALNLKDNNFVFDIKFKNTDKLNKFLMTGVVLSENSQIQGSFFPDSVISISGQAKLLSINNSTFNNLSVESSSADTTSISSLKCSSISLAGLSELKNLALTFKSIPDHFRFSADWDNKENVINKGTFIADGTFQKRLPGQRNTMLKIGILPAEIFSRNNLWKINPSFITIDSNSVKVEKLSIRNNNNYILIDGALSLNTSDTMQLEFNGINIDPLNILNDRKRSNDPNAIHLALGGILNGRIRFTDVYKNFLFESNLRLKDFTILGSQFGDISIRSVWNYNKKVADIAAYNNFKGRKMFDITGYYNPSVHNADLMAKADSLPIDLLNPLLKTFASGITGTASGRVKFSGNLAEPVLIGALKGENATLKIDYLQTRYRLNDTLRFDKDGIKFNNIKVMDDRGNIAAINGTVFHKYFKDFAVDLTISIPKTKEFMVLNTKPKDNDVFYGTAFASGVTTIKSIENALFFNISAKTGKNTRFFIPLNRGSSVTDNSFINFVDLDKDKKEAGSLNKILSSNRSSGAFDITSDLEITPDAEVRIIFDSKAGDEMKGTGTGNLNISYNRKGEFKMYGDYVIDDGEYLYTLGGILNKRFTVQNGGKISFNGNINDAEIDIKAVYKTKASLNDIMPGMLPQAKLNERIPVECLLNLTGNLFNPVVGFDINLPTADDETRAYLRSMIKTDEEMSRQFLFLLVMNSFYADQNSGASQSTADIGTTTVGVTTTEMLSNQLSHWLSQINNNFDVNVVYRPGSTAIPNSQDVQLALSTQVLNDKVTINGNFDYGSNQLTTGVNTGNNAITGAFDVEIRITERIHFKVFNRSNDNLYIDNGIQYTQGVGLFFRQDFDKLKDIFKKKEKSVMKKEEETRIKNK